MVQCTMLREEKMKDGETFRRNEDISKRRGDMRG